VNTNLECNIPDIRCQYFHFGSHINLKFFKTHAKLYMLSVEPAKGLRIEFKTENLNTHGTY